MKIIDPHVHLFDLTKGDYHWLKPENQPFWPDKQQINKNFDEHDLRLSAPFELAGFVHIEAGFDKKQPWREIEWLESQCKIPFKSIAFIDITQDENKFLREIEKLKQYHSVIGVRYIFDEQAANLLSMLEVIKNLKTLSKHNLLFELQMPIDKAKHLTAFLDVYQKIPQLKVILNHLGFPNIGDKQAYSNWQTAIDKLSQFENIYIKCSGWEMIERCLDWQQINQQIKICIEHFGENRIMLASNFPLILFSTSYLAYWQNISQGISQSLRNKLCFLNSLHCYQFIND